ncbi:MAG: hypothetical protein D8H97_27390 [Neisseria sp.]|nr:MAG: hypothetical protein D8H97_27390 [Neisseria sp.]
MVILILKAQLLLHIRSTKKPDYKFLKLLPKGKTAFINISLIQKRELRPFNLMTRKQGKK